MPAEGAAVHGIRPVPDTGAEGPAWSEPRHYRVGPVPITLICDVPGVIREFHACYHRYEIDLPPPDAFRVEVMSRRSRRSLRKYHHILGNGEQLFVTRRPDEIMPHVEWAINSLVARFLPGYLSIHASCVARAGRGVIFPAEPGRGKSTLAAGLLAAGWSYLSDEFALFDLRTGLLVPYPKALCVKAGSFAALEALGLPLQGAPVHHKRYKGRVAIVDPFAIRGDVVAGPCPLTAVIFPRYVEGAAPRLEPISRARAIFELTRVSFNFPKYRARGFELLADAVAEAECFELTAGELQATVRLLDAALATEPATGRQTG